MSPNLKWPIITLFMAVGVCTCVCARGRPPRRCEITDVRPSQEIEQHPGSRL